MNRIRSEKRKSGFSGTLALACVLAALVMPGCAKSPEKKAREERRAAAKTKVTELERSLSSGPGDAEKIVLLRETIGIETMNLGELSSALDRYQKNETLLSADPLTRCFVAVAQSMMAGREKKIENKLKWLRYGMNSFETLREDFPEDQNVYLYQASTYANFPPEVGARDEVLDILAFMRERYASGAWELSEGNASQLGYIYASLGGNFKDKESSAIIEEHRKAFTTAVPAFAAAEKKSEARE